jgi:hypothetical protein
LHVVARALTRTKRVAIDVLADPESIRGGGVHFRDDKPSGVAVRQVLLEDPFGNPIELFQPMRPEARLRPTT